MSFSANGVTTKSAMASASDYEQLRATLQRGLDNLVLSNNHKQLPLRKQTHRPMLKYNTSVSSSSPQPLMVNGNDDVSTDISPKATRVHSRPASAKDIRSPKPPLIIRSSNSTGNISNINSSNPVHSKSFMKPKTPAHVLSRTSADRERTRYTTNNKPLSAKKTSKQVTMQLPNKTPNLKNSKPTYKGHENGVRQNADGACKKGRVRDKSYDNEEWSDVDEHEEFDEDLTSERSPGDGSSFIYEDDGDEDDGIDGLDDDLPDGDDSDGYSTASTLSRNSSALLYSGRHSAKKFTAEKLDSIANEIDRTSIGSRASMRLYQPVVVDGDEIQPALTPSLFSNTPPTINFITQYEKVAQLPWELRKLLKWRMSPITPHVVKNCIARSGFRATKKSHDWLGYWGKHMKAIGFKAVREYQKVNHFPGSFQIGRKDRLWRNLSRMQVHFGKKEFGFFPQTFVLPYDIKLLKRAWEDGGTKQKWILKPPASARGIGIKVIHKWSQIPRRRPVLVQRYLSKPFLINGSKFDLRIYVYVTNYDPLRVYVFEDGLVRFATMKYSSSMKSLSNKFMHLTNYSINKKNSEFTPNDDETVCQGHKWSLKALWGYMRKNDIDSNKVWDSIKDIVIKTIISSEAAVNSLVKSNVRRRYCCHELFGFDVMLDDNLKPWIIEVNISPSLHSNSSLDVNIKGQMIKDLLNLAGFQLPDKRDIYPHVPPTSSAISTEYRCVFTDKKLWNVPVSKDERAKHAFYIQKHLDDQCRMTILDTLTPDDIRILSETEDEYSRRGYFQRVFPSPTSHNYLRYFEQPRYYNILMDEWVRKYHKQPARGIGLLEEYCREGVHVGSSDSSHVWMPISSYLIVRDTRSTSATHRKDAPPELKTSSSTSSLPRLRRRVAKSRSVQQYHGPGHTSVSNGHSAQSSSGRTISTPSVISLTSRPPPYPVTTKPRVVRQEETSTS
uniref:Tubulin polyglutamylase TTLL4-like n=1 Tax=Saccoglossus kowalevskii TaxID=10224 RepID=A0ABM0MM31_SACKO|nr:PREDICTED: tubulin polyglutamylase TTLL4-like [Saccoglossus kowalevskii]